MVNGYYHIYNVVGKLVKSGKITSNTLNLDLTDEESGIYSITLKNESSSVIKKIVLN